MIKNTALLAIAGILAPAVAFNAQAATQLAFTDFNGRTAAGRSTSGLAWTLNGLLDPGDMTNNRANLFDSKTITQNNFTPGVNVGNTNSTWITNVSLTAVSGSTVTLEDVTFNAVSISGGQDLNVNRRNDYIVSLFNPSGTRVQTVSAIDIRSGNNISPQQPLVTINFTDVVLSSGTWRLEIEAGDKPGVGGNETGNHTGIDNLSINGSVETTVIPTPSALGLGLVALGGIAARRRRK